MGTISKEEENFVRQCRLLTGVAPRCVRVVFDREFPARLKPFLVKHYGKIQSLNKRRVINKAQMTIINGASPVSDDFDITLMICFICNFSPIPQPHTGFDELPASSDISVCADLARIKYYRNKMAHSENDKTSNNDFMKEWTEVSEAIERLGGASFKLECQNLHVAKLDHSYRQEMTDMKKSLKEVQEEEKRLGEDITYLKEEQREQRNVVARHQSQLSKLKEYHSKTEELSQSMFLKLQLDNNRELQNITNKQTLELEDIRQTKQDVIPKVQRDIQLKIIEEWKEKLQNFVVTTGVSSILTIVQAEQCVLITGHPGSGKSATAFYIASCMEAHDGYNIYPVNNPKEIIDFTLPQTKQLFLFDDVFGNYALIDSVVNDWERYAKELKVHLKSNQEIRIIMTCRLDIFQKCSNKNLGLSLTPCNLHSERLQVSLEERKQIARSYLDDDSVNQLTDDVIKLYPFFPLLCQLYVKSQEKDISAFFKSPEKVIEMQIKDWRYKSNPAYLCLALLVILNNYGDKEIFEIQNRRSKELMEDLYDESGFTKLPSKTDLLSVMEGLVSIYFKETDNSFQAIHDRVFDMIVYVVGKDFKQCILKHGQSSFISNRLQFARFDTKKVEYKILLNQKEQKLYFNRVLKDIGEGKNWDVFNNCQTKFPKYRQLCLDFLKESTNLCFCVESTQMNITALMVSAYCGYDDVCSFILKYDAKQLNMKDLRGLTPLHVALGQINVVKLLLEHEALVDQTCTRGGTPLHHACNRGHIDVANLLLKHKSPVNQADNEGRAPLHVACNKGFKDIVQLLLKYQASVNQINHDGYTPLHCACKKNYKELIEILLENQASVNQADKIGWTPLHYACESGFTDLADLLLTNHASANQSDKNGHTPLLEACIYGNISVVEILLQHQASINKKALNGLTPLHIACQQNFTEITKLYFLVTHQSSKHVIKAGPHFIIHVRRDILKFLNCY